MAKGSPCPPIGLSARDTISAPRIRDSKAGWPNLPRVSHGGANA